MRSHGGEPDTGREVAPAYRAVHAVFRLLPDGSSIRLGVMAHFSLDEFLRYLKRRALRALGICVAVAAVLVGLAYCFLRQSYVSATVMILVQPRSKVLFGTGVSIGELSALLRQDPRLDAYLQVANSRRLAERIVQQERLMEFFKADSLTKATDRLVVATTRMVEPGGVVRVRVKFRGYTRLQRLLRRIEPHQDPCANKARDVALAYQTQIQDRLKRLGITQSQKYVDMLGEQKAALEKQIDETQAEFAAFKKKHKLANLEADAANLAQLYADALKMADQAMAQHQSALGETVRLEQEVGTLPETDVSTTVAVSDAVDVLEARIAERRAERARLIAVERHKESHPTVLALTKEIDELSRELVRLEPLRQRSQGTAPGAAHWGVRRRLAEVRAMADGAGAAHDVAKLALKTIESRVAELPDIEREYVNLQMRLEVLSTAYKTVMAEYQTSSLNRLRDAGDLQVLDEPVAPELPSGPRLRNIALVGFVLAFFLQLSICLHGYRREVGGRGNDS